MSAVFKKKYNLKPIIMITVFSLIMFSSSLSLK